MGIRIQEQLYCSHGNYVFPILNNKGIMEIWNRAEKFAWALTFPLGNDICKILDGMIIMNKHDRAGW